MARKTTTTKKKSAKRATAKKTAAPARKPASAGRSEPAPLDPIAAALARRRQAMIGR
jgi:hypothetical protein